MLITLNKRDQKLYDQISEDIDKLYRTIFYHEKEISIIRESIESMIKKQQDLEVKAFIREQAKLKS